MRPDAPTKPRLTCATFMILLISAGCNREVQPPVDTLPFVEVVVDEQSHRVDVMVDGRPFTSYLYADAIPTVRKPILYPVYSPSARLVTRGYPLDPNPGERADHPHQIGVWLNHGDVNNIDFWNNSEAVSPADSDHFGTIRHRRILDSSSGRRKGTLTVTSEWLNSIGSALLRERTHYDFGADSAFWFIDRTTTLTALDDSVIFEDSKEGMMAIRVARSLELANDRADPFVSDDGSLTEPEVNNMGATGQYLNSNGLAGSEVWGQRAEWVMLTGVVEGDTVSLAIFDHPANVNHPTHWMARDYGLFAANPLGSRIYSNGEEHLDMSLAPGASISFRYRILIHAGKPPSRSWLAARYDEFALQDE